MSTSAAPPRSRNEIPANMEICMNWIKVEDAHSRRPMWVNLALATAIREERDLVRISFDKDNIVSRNCHPGAGSHRISVLKHGCFWRLAHPAANSLRLIGDPGRI